MFETFFMYGQCSDNIALSAVQVACRNNIYIYAYLSICSWPRQICIYDAKAFLNFIGKLLPKHTAQGACLLYANILFCPEWSSGWMQTSTIFPCLNEVRDYMISGKYLNFYFTEIRFFTYLKLTIALASFWCNLLAFGGTKYFQNGVWSECDVTNKGR